MAINLGRLCKFNISLASNMFLKCNFLKVGVKFLYTEADLGIKSYESARITFMNQFASIENIFRSKMKEICENDGVIYTEDLKAMLHLAQNNEDDIELLNKMLEKYVVNQSADQLSTYIFGPVMMRLYYYLNQPTIALSTFENPLFTSKLYFHSVFRVLMCLLYKHNMYQEMRNLYDKFVEEKGPEYIGRSCVLILAACLKENTPEAVEYALSRWKVQSKITKPTIRSSSMVALLALKQNLPEVALEVMSTVDMTHAISNRCIKLLAYTNLERYLQIVPVLQHCIEQVNTGFGKSKIFADVVTEIEEKIMDRQDSEIDTIKNLISDIKKLDLLEASLTFEEFLLKPISIPQPERSQYSNVKFQRQNRLNRPRMPPRQHGLSQGAKNFM